MVMMKRSARPGIVQGGDPRPRPSMPLPATHATAGRATVARSPSRPTQGTSALTIDSPKAPASCGEGVPELSLPRQRWGLLPPCLPYQELGRLVDST